MKKSISYKWINIIVVFNSSWLAGYRFSQGMNVKVFKQRFNSAVRDRIVLSRYKLNDANIRVFVKEMKDVYCLIPFSIYVLTKGRSDKDPEWNKIVSSITTDVAKKYVREVLLEGFV